MRGRVKQGLGVIWLEEVTMRYGGEEGSLFDTTIRWCSAVMYNGNTRELAENKNGLHEPHKHTRKLQTN